MTREQWKALSHKMRQAVSNGRAGDVAFQSDWNRTNGFTVRYSRNDGFIVERSVIRERSHSSRVADELAYAASVRRDIIKNRWREEMRTIRIATHRATIDAIREVTSASVLLDGTRA